MLFLNYYMEHEKYKVNFSKVGEHLVRITGAFPVKEKGFYLSRLNRQDKWDYGEYKTVYRKVVDGAIFSDNGTVYVEPEVEEEPEPTEEELKEQEKLERVAAVERKLQDIDEWFRAHDYIGIKIATGRASVEEYAEEIAEMEAKAVEKEELKEKLIEIVEGKE